MVVDPISCITRTNTLLFLVGGRKSNRWQSGCFFLTILTRSTYHGNESVEGDEKGNGLSGFVDEDGRWECPSRGV